MMRALMIVALLVPGVTLAGIWPSWLSPMGGGYDRGNEVLRAAIERLGVAAGPEVWKSYATTNIFESYFAQRTKCHAAKTILGEALTRSTNWVVAFDTNGVSLTNSWTPATSVQLTKAGLLTRLGLPSNWFTNTPYFNLATETNGFTFMPLVFSNVVWMAYPVDSEKIGATNVSTWSGGGYSGSSWEGAVDAAIAAYAKLGSYNNDSPINGDVSAYFECASYSIYGYSANVWRNHADLMWKMRTADTNIATAADACDIWWQGKDPFVIGRTCVYDQFSDGPPTSYAKLGTSSKGKGATVGSAITIPTNCPPKNANVLGLSAAYTYAGWGAFDSSSTSFDTFWYLHRFQFDYFP